MTHSFTSFSSATLFRSVLLCFALLLAGLSAQAQTTNWIGGTSTDWNTPGNWSAGVPTATLDALIPNAGNQPVIAAGTSAVAKSVTINTGSSLSITNAGSLSIDGSTGNAITNNGTLTNAGNLLIGSVSSVSGTGISNAGSGTVTNQTGGTIQIDRTGSHGVFMKGGTFTNAAVLRIGSVMAVNGRGMEVEGTSLFTNAIGGIISMNRCAGLALFDGSPSFINSSTLTIGDVAFSGQDNLYLDSGGSFTNTSTGEIRADRAFGNGIWNVRNTFRNDGKIFIGSVANTGGSGILNSGISSFSNNAGALIELDRVGRAVSNTNLFINAGQIRIGQNAPLRSGGIALGNGSNTTGAVFNNLVGGTIHIDQTATGEDGILTEGSTTFTNAGTVSIGTSGSIGGNGLTNTGTFTNLACGVMKVFALLNNQDGTFTNNGLLTVSTLNSYLSPVVRVNSPAGLAGRYSFGIAQFGPPLTGVNLTADAVLVNDGTANSIQLGCSPPANAAQLAGKIALVDRGTCNFSQKVYYAQQAGAIAVVVFNNTAGVAQMGVGAFANQVTIPSVMVSQAIGQAIKTALTNGPVNMGINQEFPAALPAALTNNGIISYPQGNPIPNVTNNGVVAAPISLCFGMPYTPALLLGANSSNFTVGTTWYTNPSLTTPAGSYNQAANSFDPTGLNAVNTYPLSFTVSDIANGCVRTATLSATVSFPLSITAQPPASSTVCQGTTLSVPVGVTGTVNIYQWYKNGTAVMGQTTATLSLPSVQPSDAGTYSLVATGCNSVTSNAFTLSVNPAPTAGLFTSTDNGSFMAQATGGVAYERLKAIDRINGYEIRQTEQNSTGYFVIDRSGPFSITVIGANGCRSVVNGVAP